MQMFFVIPYRNMFAGKNIFGCVLQAYYFQFQEVRSVKWVRFFEGNCIIKWEIFFHWFLLALRFSATNYGIIKTLMMSTGTCGIKLYARNTIFKKRITNMRFWIIYILVQVSPALGRFSQCFFFLIFVDGQPWRPTILLMRPTIKKLPTALRQHAFKEMTILCSVRLICGCFVAC